MKCLLWLIHALITVKNSISVLGETMMGTPLASVVVWWWRG